MPPIQVAVKFLNIEIRSGVAYYNISVTDLHTKNTWIFESRYSRMRIVHDSLQRIAKDDVPIFPPKRCCFNTETAFVSQRQKALENYFNIVLKNSDLSELPPLKNFLYSESSKNKKVVNLNKPSGAKSEEHDFNSIFLGPKKSLGLKNAVDSFAFRFIDLTLNLTPPEEDDIRRKKSLVMSHKWPKITSKLLQDLPKGNEQNLINVKNESFPRKNEELYICMEKVMGKIKQKSMTINDFFQPEVVVQVIF